MLRTNLSTRPFYNERVVRLGILVIAALAVVLTMINVTRVVQLSRSDTRLGTQASTDEARARELRTAAVRLRRTVDPNQIEVVSDQAREANDLIDRRTFSWTELFNRFEATLPADVRITSVRPKFDERGGDVVTITVVARTVEDVNKFMENLESTGAFANLLSREERVDEDGLLEATLESLYVGEAGKEKQPK